jgi:hypothetical protein
MKRIIWLTGMSGLVAWGLAGAIAGCGGGDATIPPGEDASSPEGSTPSPSTPGTDSGAPGDAAQPGSDGGGGDAGASDSSATTSNPNKISCGAAECNVQNQLCCRSLLIDGGSSLACIDSNNGNCAGSELECDEKADCTGGDICCTNQGGFGSRCDNGCSGQNVQLCKTNAECPGDGGACKSFTCAGGRTVQACEAPVGCN